MTGLKTIQNVLMENNVSIYETEKTIYFIDPGFELPSLIEQYQSIKKEKIVLLTHTHYDHIGDVKLLNQLADKIVISSRLKLFINVLDPSLFFDSEGINLNKVVYVDDKQSFDVFQFFHTPGHSVDSMCIVLGDTIFSGDHVFKDGIGRTDLPTSNSNDMKKSLKYFLDILEDKEINFIVPGHNECVSKKELIACNRFLGY